MTNPNRTIEFYFDYISSNAYLAWVALEPLAERYGYRVEPTPTLFAGYLEAYGQLGPAEIPVKAIWMAKNNLRKAALLGVPLNPPVHHPFNPLLALRVSSLEMGEVARAKLIRALFEAVWVNGLHVSEPAVVAGVAQDVGLDGEALVHAAQQPEAKLRLRNQTDAAIKAGAFGVPSMRVGTELFWGYDDFPYMERVLAGEDPMPAGELAKWTRAARPSAMRKRVREMRGEDVS